MPQSLELRAQVPEDATFNEAAMREPMRRQSAHDRKHSSEQKSATLVATLAAESDEQVRAVVDCIVDQIEASAGAERDRALAAAAGGDDMELERDEPAAPSLPTQA